MPLVIGLAGALNYDHPDSLETGLMVRHVETLKSGAAIDAPVYDFTRHARAAAPGRPQRRGHRHGAGADPKPDEVTQA